MYTILKKNFKFFGIIIVLIFLACAAIYLLSERKDNKPKGNEQTIEEILQSLTAPENATGSTENISKDLEQDLTAKKKVIKSTTSNNIINSLTAPQ